jgi:Na+-transporting NADH:ubiquinone oxidoreductase subunit A
MTRLHRVTKGLDLRLQGAPKHVLAPAPEPTRVGVAAEDPTAITWRAVVREGDRVREGDPVLADRRDGNVRLVAPAAGRVGAITVGARRAPSSVEIERDGDDHAPADGRASSPDPATLARALQHAGLWPLFRQRPYGAIARTERAPSAIFINGMDSAPLAADPAMLVEGHDDELAAGLGVLARLCDGPRYLALRASGRHPRAFTAARGVEIHEFAGPHPSGLAGTHIDRIAPLLPGQIYWTVRAPDVIRIGVWALTGRPPVHRDVAIAGPAAREPGYRRVRQGAPLGELVGPLAADSQVIQGSVLDGVACGVEAYLGLATHTISVIAEGTGRRSVLGWVLPQIDRPSASRAALGWLTRRRAYDVDARVHGGPRALIDLGQFDRVMAIDVPLAALVRAIEADDLDEAVALGLLDLVEEDVALASFVDPCKLDFGAMVRRGLERYAAQGGVP